MKRYREQGRYFGVISNQRTFEGYTVFPILILSTEPKQSIIQRRELLFLMELELPY